MQNHMRVARESVLLQIGGVVIFAALIAALTSLTRLQLTGVPLIAAGIVLAFVPALMWLWMFYRQDRIEPEPRHYVVGIFVLGALLAYAIGQPLLRNVFVIQDWLSANALVGLLGSILVSGFVQQFLLYAAVRHTVFHSAEFDQRIDGIIYGAAAGLGYATLYNLQYVVSNQGVDLGIGVMRVAVEALSMASLGAISGYFLARAKFDSMRHWWLPLGMLLAATLNGVIDFSLAQVPMVGSGFDFNPWYGLAVAVVIAGAIFYVLFQLIQRLDVAGTHVAESRLDEPEWIVWVVVAAGLLVGWLLGSSILGQTQTATAGKMGVTFPSAWAQTSETGASFAAYDFDRGGFAGNRVSVRQKAQADLFPAEGSLADATANWAFERQKQVQAFHLLSIEPTKVQGRDAMRMEYAYLLDSPRGSTAGTMPALMRADDTLVVSGDQVYILSFAAESHKYDSTSGLHEQLLAGWRVP